LAAVLTLVASCARVPVSVPPAAPHLRPQPTALECRQLFAEIDRAVAHAKVTDGQAATIRGFPYLRGDRFLASFRDEVHDDSAFNAWVDRLQRLDEQGRAIELANMPAKALTALRQVLPATFANVSALMNVVQQCGQLLRRAQLTDAEKRHELRAAVHVPPEYVAWKRAVGLYFLTANAASAGIANWHANVQQVYAQRLRALKVHGQLVRFEPPAQSSRLSAEVVKEILARATKKPLGIPAPSGADREQLFSAFAPIFQVDVITDDDRIGAPFWSSRKDDRPSIDIMRPTVYRHLSHTRFNNEVLLQLNYIVWFPARPRTSKWDYLGGYVDGIMWRVTLSRDGTPLVFDSAHNCGCFHMFFPSPRLNLRPVPNTPDDEPQEPALVPQRAPSLLSGQGPTLRVAHRTHYIERVTARPIDQGIAVTYRWAEYDSLRSLPVTDSRRSLFRPDGIVPGTKRGERFFYWPLGVPHPGEMRQWGHHATAFVGRRHFDEPYLMQRTFELMDTQVSTTPLPR
ncbi:MAG: hypothetical protein ACE5LB_07565, partial [Acidiferrobacterales bacterium]